MIRPLICIFLIYVWHIRSQRNCIEFALKAKPVRRYIPKNRLQYKVWWLVTSQPFEYVIFVLILINTITLAMKFHKQPPTYTEALDFLNMVFTAVFALEFVLKLAAFRFKVSILFSKIKYVCIITIHFPGCNYSELFWWCVERLWFYYCSWKLHWYCLLWSKRKLHLEQGKSAQVQLRCNYNPIQTLEPLTMYKLN